MPLRIRLEANPETVQDFELASEQKYWEALELMTAGHRAAGIYLIGYAVEMWLKAACFRLDGAGPGHAVRPYLAPARRLGRALFPAIPDESYHSVNFWGELLCHKRRVTLGAFDHVLDAALSLRFTRLHTIWWIEMRYRPDQAQPAEVNTAFEDATWFRDSYMSFWR
jgi:hypothetical protein